MIHVLYKGDVIGACKPRASGDDPGLARRRLIDLS